LHVSGGREVNAREGGVVGERDRGPFEKRKKKITVAL
jgi:hypothetical protein